jgi:cytochrome P450
MGFVNQATLHSQPTTALARQAPGIKQRFRLPYGELPRARRDPLGFYCEMQRRYGDVFRWDVGSFAVHLFSHPDHVKHVLHDNHKNYPRSMFYNLVRLVTGEGLVVSEGEFWRRQRRLAQPAFHRQRIAVAAKLMTKETARMLDRWQQYADSGQPVDISQEMMRLTLCIVSQALFSHDISGDTDDVGRSVTEAMEYINYRINHILAPPLFVPTPRNLRFKRAVRRSDRLIYETIEERRGKEREYDDLLSMLMSAVDEETGERMSDQQLRDELATFLGAGHETTAVALAWTWYLLSRHPQAAERLREEVAEVLGDRTPTFDDVPQLHYTRMVLEESMRLYPPVWAVSRGVTEEDVVGGYRIPAKSLVLLSSYVTHRHPDFWSNPEGFDPERFLPARSEHRPRFAYFPFLGGPRVCIGMEFAMVEAQLVLAMTMQRYRLHLVPGQLCIPDPIFTLRPKGGVVMTIEQV